MQLRKVKLIEFEDEKDRLVKWNIFQYLFTKIVLKIVLEVIDLLFCMGGIHLW